MWETVLQVSQGLIAPLYLVFAFQIWQAARKHKRIDRTKSRVMAYLMIVFILCASAGYISHMFHFPVMWQAIAHAVLVIATLLLVISNAAAVFALMLRFDGD